MSETFTQLFTGRLVGVLDREGYDRLCRSLAGDWWQISFADDSATPTKVTAAEVTTLLINRAKEVEARNLMGATYPFTYVQTPDDPQMIKLYDPLACGSGCSTASSKPWWIVSKVAPTERELIALRGAFDRAPSSFWKKLFP